MLSTEIKNTLRNGITLCQRDVYNTIAVDVDGYICLLKDSNVLAVNRLKCIQLTLSLKKVMTLQANTILCTMNSIKDSIYLFTCDGHRDSLNLGYYATSEDGLIKLLRDFVEDTLCITMVDFKLLGIYTKGLIKYSYMEHGEKTIAECHYITLSVA